MRMLKASGSIFRKEVCIMDKLENWTEVTKGYTDMLLPQMRVMKYTFCII